jgi:hypothetical protein
MKGREHKLPAFCPCPYTATYPRPAPPPPDKSPSTPRSSVYPAPDAETACEHIKATRKISIYRNSPSLYRTVNAIVVVALTVPVPVPEKVAVIV